MKPHTASRLLRSIVTMLLLVTAASASMPSTRALCPSCQKGEANWSWIKMFSEPLLVKRDLRGPEVCFPYATCNDCSYSGTLEDFQRSLNADVREKLQREQFRMPAGTSIPTNSHRSAQLAHEMGRLHGNLPQIQAFIAMNVAWALRDEARVAPLRGIAFEDYQSYFDEADSWLRCQRMQTDFKTMQGFDRRADLSALLTDELCSLGEYDYLLQLLPQLEGLPPETAERVKALRDQERTLALKPALADALLAIEDPRTEKPAQMVYLVAELHRRLGHHDLAREWYNKALARPDLEPQIRQWIPEQIQLMDGPKKPYSPLLPAIALAGVLTLLGWKQRSRDR